MVLPGMSLEKNYMSFVCLEKCLEEDLDSRLERYPNVFAWKKALKALKIILKECLEEDMDSRLERDSNVFAWKIA